VCDIDDSSPRSHHPHLYSGTAWTISFSINIIVLLEIPQICYIMASQKSRGVAQDRLWPGLERKEKSISPLSCQKRLPSTLCTFCLITLTIAQSSFAVFFGVEREDRSPKSLLYFASFFFCYHQRASEQAGKLAFFLFLRAGALQTTKSLKENSEASENIARPLHSIGNPELRSTRRYFFV